MLDTSESYYAAITGDTRRMYIQAVIDIIDPDISYGAVSYQSAAPFSKNEQLYDKSFEVGPPYATLETNLWRLNGTYPLVPENNILPGQIGYVSNEVCGTDGTFETPQYVQLSFSNVSILQACSVFFPDFDHYGVADTFTIEVLQGGTAYWSQTITGNADASLSFTGFTVNNPDAIRVTVTKWSIPGRRMRVMDIIPGVYETWDNGIVAEFNVKQEVNFSCLSLPYGTCDISMDNLDRRFEPRNKQGIFQSIEERQGLEISLGVLMPDGTVSYQPLGKYYQYSGGWKTGDNGITMQWSLVDIIGLLADRQYLPPSTLPTTLSGWIASIVAQLGDNFADLYTVDPNYANMSLTASLEDVTGKSCGEILRMACMATQTFPRADAATGNLAVEPFWSQGAKLTLDNLDSYPTLQANDDIAAIIFTIADGNDTEYIVSGTSTASSATTQVDNPFIHTQAQALTAARMILSTYGGNKIDVSGRGNPASEIGDVDVVWLDEGTAVAGRRLSQTFAFSSGVMQGCQSVLLQADGAYLYESSEVITESGTWTAPSGVTQLRVYVVGGGSGGTPGTDGTWEDYGTPGTDGAGGYVWVGTISINSGQQFAVSIGQGGAPAQPGTATTFGQYSSANGQQYASGYTDIASGNVYARTGVRSPQPNSGGGGFRGGAGTPGQKTTDEQGNEVIVAYPGQGTNGKAGASGCVVVYWDK